ncbi:MAG: TIR domain-containing protein [Actinobacteria bacterium]|nr:TIR domain-containing protein [Actinomycetota bacterium]
MDSNQPARAVAGRIFISYRRDDSAGAARALAHDLADVFGSDAVFLDVSLHGGDTWPAHLQDELSRASVVLALIGPDWLLARDKWNRRRIDSPADWVRQEIEAALSDPDKLLIPVLLNGATLPPKEALPDVLADLTDRQARVLSHESWRWQFDALAADIKRHGQGDRPVVAATSTEATLSRYAKAQLRRVETVLRTNGLTPGAGRWSSVGPVPELVVPDLLPFQIDQPSTDHLTMDVATHLRRAVKNRARYSSKDMLSEQTPQHIVIVGGPGSGKTTLLSMLTRMLAAANIADASAKMPVLLRVRDLSVSGGESLTSDIVRDAQRWLDLQIERSFIDDLFASGQGLLIVDGVDEAQSASSRNELLAKIDLFAGKYERATIVVSSRIVGYDPRVLDRSFEHYELAPFSEQQVREVLAGALSSGPVHRGAAANDLDSEKLAKRIVADPRLSTLAETPLLLSIVVRIIMERGTVDRLPRERHSLYDTAVDMMLSEWDAQRGIETAEWPSNLDHGEIRQALETVAYRIHAGQLKHDSTSAIESATLEYELTAALEALGTVDAHRARGHARNLLRYAVVRAGLLVESGPGYFAFCHRVMQEHLAACAISARAHGLSATEPIVQHLAENGLHTPEWRNVNLLLLSMQRGDRAQRVIGYALDAGSAHEEWLHRDLLIVGEVMGESPALVSDLTDEFVTRVIKRVLAVCTSDRLEAGYMTAQAASRVLRSWRDTPMADLARQSLRDSADDRTRAEQFCAEALVGDVNLARDALVEIIVSSSAEIADPAALAVRDLDVDLHCGPTQIESLLDSISPRAVERDSEDQYFRLPYTTAELVGFFASGGPSREKVRQAYLSWVNDESNSERLRGAAATGLGWLGENSIEVRQSLIRMVLDQQISAGSRSWPAYALHRLGGGEAEVVEAMLAILSGEAPILCGWAQSYLSTYATRSPEVVARLQVLAADGDLPTLPWVLAASVRLSGLKPGQIEQLESIAASDGSMSRRVGAIETLIQCAETTADWRCSTAQRLVEALTPLLIEAPTGEAPKDEALDDAWQGMGALGSLRVSSPEARDLCLRFFRHGSEHMRMAATYGIGGLPADAPVFSAIAAMLNTDEAVGRVRGGLVDALHRVLSAESS